MVLHKEEHHSMQQAYSQQNRDLEAGLASVQVGRLRWNIQITEADVLTTCVDSFTLISKPAAEVEIGKKPLAFNLPVCGRCSDKSHQKTHACDLKVSRWRFVIT
ncbi:hypothetical protein PoB_000028100 [Plakobranchus ocellatus]|uniref:Uncharacterized protein n=1 Tax=Plakobranchus ocellatus TaxID=259542 RepID=A0AAV3WSK7_9GAST|nr:hypothetical protein PoB_000028100 [Plakobranchus ocellatus]